MWWMGPVCAMLLFLAFTFWFIVHFNQVEGTVKKGYLCYIQCQYFTVVTITTIGYGDYVLITSTSKWFTILVAVVLANSSMCTIDKIISRLIFWIIFKSRFYQRSRQHQINQAIFCIFLLMVIIRPSLIRLLEAKQTTLDNKNTKNINYTEVYYFNVISLMSVGYGDFALKSTRGQHFTSFYLLIGTLLVV